MQRIAFFGKGGSGKTTLATNVSFLLARRGMRVLHVGCDPKRDSALRLMGRRVPITMMDASFARRPDTAICASPAGIDCVETGGPPPGVGCAGRGVILTMEQFERLGLLKDGRYDVTIFDVLGDVVCGGFASPLRFGFADKLVITCSDEVMSIFAGNNIARMVCAYAKNGVALAGLVANHRSDGPSARAVVDEFAARLGTRVLAHVARDPGIGRAERAGRTVAEAEPEAPVVATLAALAAELLTIDPATLSPPTPMDDDALDAFVRSLPPP